MTHRVFIIEDHDWLREMLAEYVGKIPDVEVCGAVRTGEEGLEELARVPADLVLVDLLLPSLNGDDVVREILCKWPDMRCLVLSAHPDSQYLDRALSAGAHGFVRKNDPQELKDAIHAVLNGERYFGTEAGPRRLGGIGRDDGTRPGA